MTLAISLYLHKEKHYPVFGVAEKAFICRVNTSNPETCHGDAILTILEFRYGKCAPKQNANPKWMKHYLRLELYFLKKGLNLTIPPLTWSDP